MDRGNCGDGIGAVACVPCATGLHTGYSATGLHGCSEASGRKRWEVRYGQLGMGVAPTGGQGQAH